MTYARLEGSRLVITSSGLDTRCTGGSAQPYGLHSCLPRYSIRSCGLRSRSNSGALLWSNGPAVRREYPPRINSSTADTRRRREVSPRHPPASRRSSRGQPSNRWARPQSTCTSDSPAPGGSYRFDASRPTSIEDSSSQPFNVTSVAPDQPETSATFRVRSTIS